MNFSSCLKQDSCAGEINSEKSIDRIEANECKKSIINQENVKEGKCNNLQLFRCLSVKGIAYKSSINETEIK